MKILEVVMEQNFNRLCVKYGLNHKEREILRKFIQALDATLTPEFRSFPQEERLQIREKITNSHLQEVREYRRSAILFVMTEMMALFVSLARRRQ